MISTTRAPAQTVRLFSITDALPPALAEMDRETIAAHIQKANRVLEHHRDVARNGDEAAEHYYFYIPQVSADMANARYTLAVCFAELQRRRKISDGPFAENPVWQGVKRALLEMQEVGA